ncbi:MAG: sulfite exporter TauE/SafE family protein [Rubrivivax sp.]
MDLALIASCAMLGLAGTPHCAAMCGAPCAALATRRSAVPAGIPAAAVPSRGLAAGSESGLTASLPGLAFHAARAAGYALAGGLAAAGVGAVAWLAAAAPMLRPFWVLLHVAALSVGLWMAATGRQPAWVTRLGHRPVRTGAWQPLRGPGRVAVAGATGALWVGWPCGLLQSALVVAALCNSATAGATAMLGFALASAPGLLAGPWIFRQLGAAGAGAQARVVSWAVRLAGAALAAGAVFALNRDWWGRLLAYCGL